MRNIKKGDLVKILTGKDKGKTGKVLKVLGNKVSVEGLNLKFKHLKARQQGESGQKIQFPAPLDISNVMLICPKCNRPTRVGKKFLKSQEKVRFCKKCQETFK